MKQSRCDSSIYKGTQQAIEWQYSLLVRECREGLFRHFKRCESTFGKFRNFPKVFVGGVSELFSLLSL